MLGAPRSLPPIPGSRILAIRAGALGDTLLALPSIGALRKLAVGGRVAYELNGTVGVDAGRLGTPTFGPMLLTRGEMRVVR